MISFGVPAGTRMPCQLSPTTPGKPPSAVVGTSGSDRERAALVTARPRSLPSTTCCAAAADVLDEELLAGAVRNFLGQQTRHHIGRPAGRIGNDHAHRPIRIALRTRDARCGRESGGTCCETEKSAAIKFHRAVLSMAGS